MRKFGSVRALALAFLLAVSPSARAEDLSSRLAAVDVLLSQWRVAEAVELAEDLYGRYPDVPAVQDAAGRVKFHQSDYVGAVTLLEKAASAFKGGNDRAAGAAMSGEFLQLARATRDATAGFVATDSSHFSFRAAPGRDQVLARYALEALEAAYTRLSRDFAHAPRERIVIEAYPSARALAQVSTLTEKEIETSGTIAICKFNRLMFTSPRALMHGYAWLDTLAHEYTHLVVSQKSHNTVSIWLHEGLAKYSETSWRGVPGESLSGWQENMLARAIKADKLITFEQMHPSMAKLPSQQDTALAFAEVFTVIEYLHRGGPACARRSGCPDGTPTGYAVTNAIIDQLRGGAEDEQAIEHVLGVSFDAFKKDWMKWLKARPSRTSRAQAPAPLAFKKGNKQDDEDRDDSVDPGLAAEVRRWARLGNLLREAGRPRAAAMEYERAVQRAGTVTPLLHTRLASAYLEAGDDQKALATLEAIREAFPDHAQTQVLLGRIHYKRQEWQPAAQSYELANRTNPFNPEIHLALAEIYGRLQREEAKTAEEHAARLLIGAQVQQEQGSLVTDPNEPSALLAVETRPWAQLILDERDVGFVTPVEIRIRPGQHTMRLKNPALAIDRTMPLVVKPGDEARLRLDLLQPAP